MTLTRDKKLLATTLRKPRTVKTLADLLDDLLTEDEILDLAARLKIAKLITRGLTYETIAKKLQVSTSTVTKIGHVLKYGRGALRKIIK